MKTCPNCRRYLSSDDLLNNAEVEPIGMCFEERDVTLNMFYFNHNCAGCGTTFTVRADEFTRFITEPITERILAGRPECRDHCTDIDDLTACRNECKWAPFRRFMLSLLERRGLQPVDSAANQASRDSD